MLQSFKAATQKRKQMLALYNVYLERPKLN